MEMNKEITGYLHLIVDDVHQHTINYKFKSLTQQEELINYLLTEASNPSKAYVIQCDEDNQYIATH